MREVDLEIIDREPSEVRGRPHNDDIGRASLMKYALIDERPSLGAVEVKGLLIA
ncbi:hypothetical protein OAV07_01225 [Acidimicrobiales bacterium]|nr:hypothetical protein [Acidimicrobiales bacterium]MDC3300123.1 hypothetical protein [Acidimicrobiales bacterium]